MRFVVMMVFVFASGVVAADWKRVGTTESDTDFYVDHATISRSGHLAKMWILEDRKAAGTFAGKTFQSAKLHYEYDCKDNQRRVLQSSLYSGQKGGGTNVQTGTKAGPWRPISPGRVSETMWKIACGRK